MALLVHNNQEHFSPEGTEYMFQPPTPTEEKNLHLPNLEKNPHFQFPYDSQEVLPEVT
jgi:hypothetical protein